MTSPYSFTLFFFSATIRPLHRKLLRSLQDPQNFGSTIEVHMHSIQVGVRHVPVLWSCYLLGENGIDGNPISKMVINVESILDVCATFYVGTGFLRNNQNSIKYQRTTAKEYLWGLLQRPQRYNCWYVQKPVWPDAPYVISWLCEAEPWNCWFAGCILFYLGYSSTYPAIVQVEATVVVELLAVFYS